MTIGAYKQEKLELQRYDDLMTVLYQITLIPGKTKFSCDYL